MGPDIASRIRARLSRRRRHSTTPSLASSPSENDDSNSNHKPSAALTPQETAKGSDSTKRRHMPFSIHRRSQSQLDRRDSGFTSGSDDKSDRDPRALQLSCRSDSGISRSWVVTPAEERDDEFDGGEDLAPRPADTQVAPQSGGDDSLSPSPGRASAERAAATDAEPSPGTQAPQLVVFPDAGGRGATPATASLTNDCLGNDLRAKRSNSPLLLTSSTNLHSIHEDSTSTTSNNSDGDNDSDDDSDRDQPLPHRRNPRDDASGLLSISNLAAHTPATSADTVASANFLQGVLEAPSTPSSTATGPVISPSGISSLRPPPAPRRQSLISNRHSALIKTLLQSPQPLYDEDDDDDDNLHHRYPAPITAGVPIVSMSPAAPGTMVTRKVWVRRPGASATLISIGEDDLVDDVRDMILRKYANSLGRNFDAPDLVIRIGPRDHHHKDRALGPEESMSRTLDAYYPGGQTVEEALVIDIPRRTPKASPRAPLPHTVAATTLYYADDGRPSEAGEGYFPPVGGPVSPHLPLTAMPAPTNGNVPHSIAVLGTGHIPPIPSPGGTRRTFRDRPERPRLGRTHTASPVAGSNIPSGALTSAAAAVAGGTAHGMTHYLPRKSHSRAHSESSEQPPTLVPNAIPMPTSPVAPDGTQMRVSTPPPRVASPRASSSRPKKIKKHVEQTGLSGILNGSVPPINVLIVEDNPINLKLLEMFVKKLKVRWKTAMNGKEAVRKWRTGGFHLVLMDIQLPVMNGLDATREIRRLESVNSIGVFSSPTSPQEETNGELKEPDRLSNIALFKSPVIIVALTASSLQSDRHEALAAGCNDFLTKPVNFEWLERKVMEWGCMQALIDFDGWRKWKDFSNEAEQNDTAKKPLSYKYKPKKNRSSLSSST